MSATKVMSLVKSASRDIALPRYDDMCRAIAECHRVDEAKDIRDRAEALRAYAKQANNREAEVQFAECKVRAEIKCGELLQEMALNGGDRKSESHDARVKLKDLGVTPDQSSRFQESARAPRERVEEVLKASRETHTPVTSARIRGLTKQPDFTPAQRADHERLWRVLRALEQISDQDIEPDDWLGALPDYMQERVTNHLSRARPWLEALFAAWDARNAD